MYGEAAIGIAQNHSLYLQFVRTIIPPVYNVNIPGM
jgi:hypothetical protein